MVAARGRSVRVILALVVSLSAGTAMGDDEAIRKRIEELEEQQRTFNAELQKLREELDRRKEASPVIAAPEPTPAREAEPARVEEVERRQGILTQEVRRIRELLVLPENQELKSHYGLGPAASKVYGISRGVSIGGYGEANYKNVVSDANGSNDEFDFVRLVAYVGYKFNDWIVFNSEIEFEHATSEESVSASDGEVGVEFAALDFLFHPALNVRGGLVLVPVGFINQIHEPPFYLGNTRPPVEQLVIPSTWRANGVGLFGQPIEGLEYKLYGITSLNAKGYESLDVREARQNGNRERAEDWSFVARADYTVLPEWSIGGSLYVGDQGQGEQYGNEDTGFRRVGAFTQLYEVHSELRTHGLELRALGTTMLVDDAGQLSRDDFISSRTGGAPIGEVMLGAYAEIAYDVLPLLWPETTQYLAPWFRYSWLDTNNEVPNGFSRDRTARRDFYEFGLQYKPIPQVVLKTDYHIQDSEKGTLPDEIRLGGGFVF
jgi:hypothetical protein